MKQSNLIEKCQMCGSRSLSSVLFLGYLPPVNHLQSSATDSKSMNFGSCPFELD